MKHRWAAAGTEPSLAEILSDPIVHQVMRRDRLSLDTVRFAIRMGQEALRRRTERDGPADARRTAEAPDGAAVRMGVGQTRTGPMGIGLSLPDPIRDLVRVRAGCNAGGSRWRVGDPIPGHCQPR